MPYRQHHAHDLITRACSAHGGIERWSDTSVINGAITRLGGPIPVMKGLGRTFAPPRAFSVYLHEHRVEFHEYPMPGGRIIYEGDGDTGSQGAGVRVIDRSGERWQPDYRRRFAGLRKLRRWNHSDAAYFFGYALLTYLSVPFILDGCEVIACDHRSVTVRFAAGFETHCRIQRFHFDANGLLVRHDYTADVLGAVFRGAHYSSGYADVNGLRLARRRHVLPRLTAVLTAPLPVLYAHLHFDRDA